MKAILLSRVSTEEQRGALSAQTFRLEEYVSRNGFSPVEAIEFDESAYKLDRGQFNRLIIKPIEQSKEKVALICDKIDRLIRNYGPDLTKLEALRLEDKVELHFPSDNIILTRSSPAADLFRFGIGISLAKYYSDTIRDNVKRRFEQMARDGKLFTRAPLGYTNVLRPDGSKWVQVDEERRAHILTAFQMRAEGMSYALIAKTLSAAGLHSKSSKRQPLTQARVEELLSNAFYAGLMSYRGDLTKHIYEPIVTTALFEKVQHVKIERSINRFKTDSKEFLFKGLVTCGHCGYNVVSDMKKNKYTYLKCTEYGGSCGAMRVKEEGLVEQVANLLAKIQIPIEAIKLVLDRLNEDLIKESSRAAEQHKLTEAEYANISRRLEIMYEDRLEGRISKSEYDILSERYKAEMEAMKPTIAQGWKELTAQLRSAEEIMMLASRAKELFLSDSSKVDEKRALLKSVVSNSFLDGQKMRFELKTPFDVIAECSNTANWYPLADVLRTVGITTFNSSLDKIHGNVQTE